MPRREQYTGCLLGLAIGDALGFPVEGMSLERIRRTFGPAGVQDFVNVGQRGLPHGCVSDDTQMTMAVARALLEAGRKSIDELMAAMCRQFVAWYQSPEIRGPGMTTLAACANLARGVPWNVSGIRESKGCGAAMRVAPIGLYYYRDPEQLRHVTEASALATHAHPTGVAAAVVNAVAVARALEKASPKRILEELISIAARLSGELEAALKKVKECEGMEPSEAFARFGETGSAEEVFASALFCFLRAPEDYRATVLAGANSNGDSDSIAAQAGALSGAYNGAAALPEAWRRGVENAAELERLASELFTHAPGGW
ncbi:MAG: ADP-ribosylglycohydrolase family protein [Candidatus Acidoferrales bacterium]